MLLIKYRSYCLVTQYVMEVTVKTAACMQLCKDDSSKDSYSDI